jgi:Arc/MetJ-type ribon-helix-helix transcriptional regulator
MGTETQRITVRVPVRDVEIMEALVEAGEYPNRTAVVRRAIRDFIKEKGSEMKETVESQQDLTEALQQMQQMQEQIEAQRELLESVLQQ